MSAIFKLSIIPLLFLSRPFECLCFWEPLSTGKRIRDSDHHHFEVHGLGSCQRSIDCCSFMLCILHFKETNKLYLINSKIRLYSTVSKRMIPGILDSGRSARSTRDTVACLRDQPSKVSIPSFPLSIIKIIPSSKSLIDIG
jgi:hypothetical protein